MVDSAGDSSFNSNNNFNNNNNNNNNNVTYKAQIRSGSKCAVSRVSVKQKCFQSLPEGTRGYVLYIIFLILVLLVVGIFYTQINDVSFRIYTSGCSLQLYSHYFHVSHFQSSRPQVLWQAVPNYGTINRETVVLAVICPRALHNKLTSVRRAQMTTTTTS